MESNLPQNQESQKAGPSQTGAGFAFMRYSGMAFQLMIIIGLFTYAGKWLDEYLQNKFPLFLLIGALTGTIGSIYKIIAELTGRKPKN